MEKTTANDTGRRVGYTVYEEVGFGIINGPTVDYPYTANDLIVYRIGKIYSKLEEL